MDPLGTTTTDEEFACEPVDWAPSTAKQPTKLCRWKVWAIGLVVLIVGVIVIVPATVVTAKKKQQSKQQSSNEKPACPVGGGPYVATSCPSTSSSMNSSGWTQIAEEIAGEAAFDLSGYSISMSCDGSILAISAMENDGNGDKAGHVRVYQHNSTAWNQLGQDIDGENAKDQSGIGLSISSDGFRMAVGARFNDGENVTNVGHVRVFDYSPETGNWTQFGLDIDGEAANDGSGQSVSLSSDGERLAVGAPGNDENGDRSGHVRVYEVDSNDEWTQLGNDIDGEAEGDNFGRDVSMSPDATRVAVGAYKNSNNDTNSEAGHVRIYEYDDSNTKLWTQVGQDIDGEEDDWAGFSISMSLNNRVAVASRGSNNRVFGLLVGHAKVYELVNNTWTQMGSDLTGGQDVSLSLDGTRVAVGDHRGANNAGHVHVYEFVDGDWVPLGEVIVGNSNDMSGTSVALSADGLRVAVSSPAVEGYSGVARVYDIC
eukprot:scaffold2595_cov49-Attheya_sp.AAC.1